MSKLGAAEMAAKWAKNFASSGESYKAGVGRVTTAPAQLAIAARDRMLANFTQAVNSGRWEARMGQVTVAAWRQACVEKGAPAMMAAAKVAQERVAANERRMGPARDAIIAALPPRGDINANIERSAEFQRKMHELKAGAFGGGGQF